jgi:hypothetical protein
MSATKTVQITHRVEIVTQGPPIRGQAFYDAKGRLIFITDGADTIDGRVSNFFRWQLIRKNGTLGNTNAGFWQWGNVAPSPDRKKTTTNPNRRTKK